MKKMFLILLIIGCVFADKMITANACNLRDNHSVKAEKIITILQGEELETVGQYGDWIYVKVLSGDHIGAIGYMWVKLVKQTDDGFVADKQGCSLREEPSGKSKRLAKIGGGRDLEIIKTVVTWYKIKYKKYTGWIYQSSLANLK